MSPVLTAACHLSPCRGCGLQLQNCHRAGDAPGCLGKPVTTVAYRVCREGRGAPQGVRTWCSWLGDRL